MGSTPTIFFTNEHEYEHTYRQKGGRREQGERQKMIENSDDFTSPCLWPDQDLELLQPQRPASSLGLSIAIGHISRSFKLEAASCTLRCDGHVEKECENCSSCRLNSVFT